MAAACSGRAFAPPPDDVDALIAAMERREASKLTPRYARTVTSPLVAALRARLVISTGLSVFLAHDTTLMPLLVALTTDYDGAWAPYAAAVVVETWTLPGGSAAVGNAISRDLRFGGHVFYSARCNCRLPTFFVVLFTGEDGETTAPPPEHSQYCTLASVRQW